jgi:NAD+ kinase
MRSRILVMNIEKLGLIVKENDERAKKLASDVVKYITKTTSWKIFTPSDEKNGLKSFKRIGVVPEDLYSFSDVFVVLGGDGTMLQAASYTKTIEDKVVPVLGINLGRIGYLSTIPPEDVFTELDRLKENENKFIPRKMLRVKDPVNKNVEYPVLNEVVLHWSRKARLINLHMSIDGDGEFETRADGIIISTPTGSTAYNHAAGGPLVHHDIDAMIMTPICPFSGLKGSLELPISSKVVIRSDERNRDVSVTIDGYTDFPLHKKQKLCIDQHPTPFVLVNPRISSFLETLQTKLSILQNNKG